MLARSLSRYRFFDLSAVPPADQLAALRGQLAAWQPFPQSRFWVQWQGGRACVHAGPADALADAPARATVWPEASLNEPMAEGLRLVSCVEGIEAQSWREGLLRTSQWWPAAPTPAEWVAFVRASGLPPRPMPQAQPAAWRLPSIKVQPLERLSQSALAPVRTLVGAMLLVLLVLTTYAGRTYWEAREAAAGAASQLAELQAKAQPITRSRERAATAQAQLDAVVKPLQAAQPLEVLDHLARLLPKDVLLKEFDLQGLEVRVLLETPADLARSKLFEALESGEWFSKVTEQTGARAGIALQFRLSGVRPPMAAQAAATGVARRSSDTAAPSVPPPPVVPPGLR